MQARRSAFGIRSLSCICGAVLEVHSSSRVYAKVWGRSAAVVDWATDKFRLLRCEQKVSLLEAWPMSGRGCVIDTSVNLVCSTIW
jgi:hypothetical protein